MQTDRKVKSQVFKTENKSMSLALLSLSSLKKFHQEHPGFPLFHMYILQFLPKISTAKIYIHPKNSFYPCTTPHIPHPQVMKYFGPSPPCGVCQVISCFGILISQVLQWMQLFPHQSAITALTHTLKKEGVENTRSKR